MKARLGPDHPRTLSCMSALATGYRDAGMLSRALPLYEDTLAIQRVKVGKDHIDTLLTMSGLANAFRKAGKLDRALVLYEETLASCRRSSARTTGRPSTA